MQVIEVQLEQGKEFQTGSGKSAQIKLKTGGVSYLECGRWALFIPSSLLDMAIRAPAT